MTKKENNKYAMYKSLMTVLNENSEKINSVDGLKTVSGELAESIDNISETDNRYKNLSKGVTGDKYNSKDTLIGSLLITANVLYVYAKRTDNFQLKEQSDIVESGLKKGRDNELVQKAKAVIKNSEKNAGEIVSFHKEFNEEVKVLKELLAAFEASVNNQSSKSAERQASREALTEAFKKADDIIKEQLDPLIELIKEKEIDIYNQYYAARTIKDLGVRKSKAESLKSKEEENMAGAQNIEPIQACDKKEESLKN